MNTTSSFRDLINLVEARIETADYVEKAKEVAATLVSYDSMVYTKLGQKVQRIAALEEEISALKEEVKQESREKVADLFDAEDAAKTRVVETIQFIFTLSKDPAPTVTPKYKDILGELEKHLTPELIQVLEALKTQMVTVTQKSPSLKVKQKEITEGIVSGFFAKFKNMIMNWGAKYDQKLDRLKQLAGTPGEELDETVNRDELTDLDDIERRLKHCKRALGMANGLGDAADRKKWKGAALRNMNIVRNALNKLIASLEAEQPPTIH